MGTQRRATAIWGAVAVVVLLATSCGSGDGSAEADDPGEETDRASSVEVEAAEPTTIANQRVVPGGKVVYGLIAETNNWDPSAGQWGPWSLIVANALFDTLTRYDADGRIEPYLAEGFYPAQDYSQWRIKTREGVTFHNGEPLDAQAVADNLEFHRTSPLTGSVFERVTDIEVIDERNVRIVLTEPVVQFPGIFATQVGVMMAPEMIANSDRGREPIGTGPFRLDEWVPDASMVLVRNDDYWQTDADGNALPYLDEVEFRPITDDEARKASLLTGEVDVAQINVPQDLAEIGEEGELQVFADPTSESDESFVMLNTATPPFDDPVARQALAYATDREAYNETLNDGVAEVAEGPFRTESRWYHDVDFPDYDPDKARELVAEYEDEHGPLEFTLLGNAGVRSLQGSQLLQEQWAEVGIDATIESSEIATQITDVVFGDYQATTWQQFGSAHPSLEEAWWGCDFVEPIPEVSLNFARNCNEDLTEQMALARQDTSGVELSDDGAAIVSSDELKPYFDRVQDELAADLPYIWLWHIDTAAVARPNVRGVLDQVLPSGAPAMALNNGAHTLHQMWVEQ